MRRTIIISLVAVALGGCASPVGAGDRSLGALER